MTIDLIGRIDSNNAAQVERDILVRLGQNSDPALTLDAEKLEYISSAGLRVLLRIRRSYPEMRIIHVNSEVYEILDMTGFTEMMKVEKAYRRVSIEGCEEIGRGANGKIYRIDQDNVVKVYKNADALADIQHEREVAKLALILGIPTAISYDVVKVGESYGSVFELLNARSFSKILVNDPGKLDWCVAEYVKMLKRIHATLVPEGKLPDMRATAISWARFLQDYLPEEAAKKLLALVEAVPHDDHMIHGDYHTKNLELQNDEVLLIDMDTLAVGYPIFELGSMFNSFIGFSELNHEVIEKFQGFNFETGVKFWYQSLGAYLGTKCESKIREVDEKARIIGYTRLIRRSIRRGGLEDPRRSEEIRFWKGKLLELLERVDSLQFAVNELELPAEKERLPELLRFVEERLSETKCTPSLRMQISVAVEDIFANIANYAYAPEKGNAAVRVEIAPEPLQVSVTFLDRGKPFDPLAEAREKLPGDGEESAALGMFLTRKLMDDVAYAYRDGRNILTLKKNL